MNSERLLGICLFSFLYAVVHPGMGGPPLPIDQNLGLVAAVCLRHGGEISCKSLTFDHILYGNGQKAFSSGGLRPLALPRGIVPGHRWGLCPIDPCYRLALRALAIIRPLANPGSATASMMMMMMQASDADSGDNAQLEYSLSSQSHAVYSQQFSADRLTGDVRLESPLDRERTAVLELTVCL